LLAWLMQCRRGRAWAGGLYTGRAMATGHVNHTATRLGGALGGLDCGVL